MAGFCPSAPSYNTDFAAESSSTTEKSALPFNETIAALPYIPVSRNFGLHSLLLNVIGEKMSSPPETPIPEAMTVKQMAFGILSLILIGWYLYAGIANFFHPPRSLRLKEPVREIRTSDESKVRRSIEEFAQSAIWQGEQSGEYPLERIGAEPSPSVSIYDFCNRSGRNLTLYFDGMDIFTAIAPAGGSIEVQLRSGDYDLLIVAPGKQPGTDMLMLAPFYRRLHIAGAFHDQFIAEDAAKDIRTTPCTGRHVLIHSIP